MIKVREMDIEFYRHYADNLEAARRPAWLYNEMKPCGVNYNNTILARLYDTYHRLFRDYRQEAEDIVTRLGLDGSATVMDIGCWRRRGSACRWRTIPTSSWRRTFARGRTLCHSRARFHVTRQAFLGVMIDRRQMACRRIAKDAGRRSQATIRWERCAEG